MFSRSTCVGPQTISPSYYSPQNRFACYSKEMTLPPSMHALSLEFRLNGLFWWDCPIDTINYDDTLGGQGPKLLGEGVVMHYQVFLGSFGLQGGKKWAPVRNWTAWWPSRDKVNFPRAVLPGPEPRNGPGASSFLPQPQYGIHNRNNTKPFNNARRSYNSPITLCKKTKKQKLFDIILDLEKSCTNNTECFPTCFPESSHLAIITVQWSKFRN